MDPHNTATITTWVLFFAAMFAATGCTPEVNRLSTIEVPKENKVEFLHLDHPVHFVPGTTQLAAGEDKSLGTFVATVRPDSGDEVTIDTHGAATPSLQAGRQASIARQLRHLGVRPSPRQAAGSGFAAGSDEVLVRVSRYIVTPPRCPDWSAPEAGDYSNTPPTNFGCATVTNLGLMVANPAELVRGSAAGGADGDVLARGVERYRAGTRSKSGSQGSESGDAGGQGTGGQGISGQGTGGQGGGG